MPELLINGIVLRGFVSLLCLETVTGESQSWRFHKLDVSRAGCFPASHNPRYRRLDPIRQCDQAPWTNGLMWLILCAVSRQVSWLSPLWLKNSPAVPLYLTAVTCWGSAGGSGGNIIQHDEQSLLVWASAATVKNENRPARWNMFILGRMSEVVYLRLHLMSASHLVLFFCFLFL